MKRRRAKRGADLPRFSFAQHMAEQRERERQAEEARLQMQGHPAQDLDRLRADLDATVEREKAKRLADFFRWLDRED